MMLMYVVDKKGIDRCVGGVGYVRARKRTHTEYLWVSVRSSHGQNCRSPRDDQVTYVQLPCCDVLV